MLELISCISLGSHHLYSIFKKGNAGFILTYNSKNDIILLIKALTILRKKIQPTLKWRTWCHSTEAITCFPSSTLLWSENTPVCSDVPGLDRGPWDHFNLVVLHWLSSSVLFDRPTEDIWLRQTRKSLTREVPQPHFGEPQPPVTRSPYPAQQEAAALEGRLQPAASKASTNRAEGQWTPSDQTRTLTPVLCPFRFGA